MQEHNKPSRLKMWEKKDSLNEESICGRFSIFHLFSGKTMLIDKGTEKTPRRLNIFSSAKGAKNAAKKRLSRTV